MRNKITLSSILFVVLSMLFAIPTNAANGAEYNWYCVHRKDHSQPSADPQFEFIENLDGYYIDKRNGDDCEDRVIYLTFDAGYENGNIEKTLDILKKQNVSGAFFILGNLIKSNPNIVTRMFEEGHLVCNHTYSHKSMINKTAEEFKNELVLLENACRDKIGYNIAKYYRPPEGKFDEASLSYAKSMGYKTVFWSFAYADWDNNKQMTPEKAKAKILDNIHNGEVMLLHPTSSTNAQILEEVIITLKSQGYRFGTLDELCER